MPGHWDPWPGKTNTVLPGVLVPWTSWGWGWSVASARRAVRSSWRVVPMVAARWVKGVRVSRVVATCSGVRSGWVSRWSARR